MLRRRRPCRRRALRAHSPLQSRAQRPFRIGVSKKGKSAPFRHRVVQKILSTLRRQIGNPHVASRCGSWRRPAKSSARERPTSNQRASIFLEGCMLHARAPARGGFGMPRERFRRIIIDRPKALPRLLARPLEPANRPDCPTNEEERLTEGNPPHGASAH